MNNYKKLIGEFGESLARDYLISKGYRILNMNYRNRFGEIDIVCMNKDLLIFCEIKSRYSNSFGFPIESVINKIKLLNSQNYIQCLKNILITILDTI